MHNLAVVCETSSMELPANLVIVGLHSERPRSGKTTVSRALAEQVGGRVYSIAGGVRDVARELGFAVAADAAGHAKDVPLEELDGRTPRQVLIQIGEARCAMHGRDHWLLRLLERIVADAGGEDAVAVIDDVRRLEEGQGLVDRGATVCTIVRDGAPDVVDINGWSSGARYTFRNDGLAAECADRIWARVLRDLRSS